MLTETWLNDQEKEYFSLSDYNGFHACRKGTGGGVSVFVRKDWFADLVRSTTDYHNLILIKIDLKGSTFNILAVYNPQFSNSYCFLRVLEEYLSQTKLKCIVLGDFNIDLFKENNCKTDYISLMSCYNFNLLNSKHATRISDTSATLIDHIWSNNNKYDHKILNILNDFSDHNILIYEMYAPKQTLEKRNRINSATFTNYQKLEWYLQNNPLVHTKDNLNTYYTQFLNYIQHGINQANSPVNNKLTNKNGKLPWINNILLSLIHKKEKLYAKSKCKDSSLDTKLQYKKICNEVTKLKRELHKQYVANKLNNVQSIKSIWEISDDLLGRNKVKSNNIPCLHYNDSTIDNPKEIANVFNNHFVNVAKNLADRIPLSSAYTYTHLNVPNSFFFTPTNNVEISNTLNKLKNSGSLDVDGLTNKLLKRIATHVIQNLTDLVNLSLENGVVPDGAKIAKVIPIYKQGSKTQPTNYRPISILPVFSKILENVVKSRLTQYLCNIKFFSKAQYGFVKNSSTLSIATDTVSYLQDAMDSGQLGGALFIDLKKAFDTVDHSILLYKLEMIGVRGLCLDWFKSYLTNRQQYTRINNVNSTIASVTIGVPQGSVLGPLLFIIYINDISYINLKGTIKLYADDTAILYKGKTESDVIIAMQHDINKIILWMYLNRLSVNAEKTKGMLFHSHLHTSRIPYNLTLGSNKVEIVNSYKYVGLVLDSCLSWNMHVTNISNKLLPIISIFHRLKYLNLPDNLCKNLYYAFIHSRLSYMNVIWSSCNDTLLRRLEILQNRSLRTLFNLPFQYNRHSMYLSLKILPLHLEIDNACLILIYKIINHKTHSNISLLNCSDIHNHNLRRPHNIHTLSISTTRFGTKNIIRRCVQLYNLLPNKTKLCISTNSYKKEVKKYLWKSYETETR